MSYHNKLSKKAVMRSTDKLQFDLPHKGSKIFATMIFVDLYSIFFQLRVSFLPFYGMLDSSTTGGSWAS